LFGSEFEAYGSIDQNDYNFVLDNSYLYILIHDGLLIFVGIMAFYLIKVKKSFSNSNNATTAALVSYTFVGLMARSLTSVMKNQFLILPEDEEKNKE